VPCIASESEESKGNWRVKFIQTVQSVRFMMANQN